MAAPKDYDTLFNPDDFKSVQIAIDLLNSTTNTKIQKGKRFYGAKAVDGPEASVQFCEFLDVEQDGRDEGMVLDVPDRSCNTGHTLVLDISTEGAKEDLRFQVYGKVVDLERLEGSRNRISVEIFNYDESDWLAFKRIFTSRQQEIEDLFRAIKGH